VIGGVLVAAAAAAQLIGKGSQQTHPKTTPLPTFTHRQDVVALIAYESPEASPLGSLMSPAQREKVADVVNSAVLSVATAAAAAAAASSGGPEAAAAEAEGEGGATAMQTEGGAGGGGEADAAAAVDVAALEQQPVKSSMERLLAQLVAVHQVLQEENGGRGEPFDLRQHLGPQQQPS